MRRKLHDLRDWTGALDFTQRLGHHPDFLLVDFVAHRVRRPLEAEFGGEPLQLFAHGHRWVRAHPRLAPAGVVGEALTVLLDAAGQPLQLYIDIHQGGGFDESAAVPWIDDLYLDVAGLFGPGWQPRHLLLLDEDELRDAELPHQLSAELAGAVRQRGVQVMRELREGRFVPLQVIREYVARQPG